MNSYYLYDGERLEERPEYDGEHRWCVAIWQEEYFDDPHTWGDSPWKWAGTTHWQEDGLPSDTYKDYAGRKQYYKGVNARYADDLQGLTHYGKFISVPIVGRVNYNYGRAGLEIGSWQDVRDGKERQLAEAFCSWEDARKWFGDLPRQELFKQAIKHLEGELQEFEEYVEWGTWGFTIVDLLFDDDGESVGGFYGNPENDCTDEALSELAHMEQDTEGDHLALAYIRRFG